MKKALKVAMVTLLLIGAALLGFNGVASARENKEPKLYVQAEKQLVRPYPYFQVRPYVYFYHYPYYYFRGLDNKYGVGEHKIALPTRSELMKKFGLN